MRQKQHKLDNYSLAWATNRSKDLGEDYAAKSLLWLTDPNKAKRLEVSKCKTCFYIWTSRVGGAAITYRPCGVCAAQMSFGSTATDVFCLACAKEHELCVVCGGDVHLRVRRKWKDIPVTVAE